jgi:hypothetical protein
MPQINRGRDWLRQDDYLRFTRDWRAPPDNNGCERDIRMAKLKQKVSGCLRTLTGARQFCAIRSYLSTAAKHDLGLFDALIMLTGAQPWIPTARNQSPNRTPDQLPGASPTNRTRRHHAIVTQMSRSHASLCLRTDSTTTSEGVTVTKTSAAFDNAIWV